jgi:response regulator RpfG family c-di-GMP phosphodiesterase
MPAVDPTGFGELGPVAGAKMLERLLADGVIVTAQYERSIVHARRKGIRAEEALLELGDIDEATFLGKLASRYRTQFVSTEKLAKATVSPALVRLVPQKVAERLGVCPVLFDRASVTLSVVAGDLETHDLEKQLQLLTNVKNVRVLFARPLAVHALIRKHYGHESDAFQTLLSASRRADAGFDVQLDYKREGASDPSVGIDFGVGLEPAAPPAPPVGATPQRIELPASPPSQAVGGFELGAGAASSRAFERDSQLELVNVLVALLEQDRGDLRGHSAQAARLSKTIGKLLGMNDDALYGLALAATLHDIGKVGTYHLTAMNVARYDGHRARAEKTRLAPVKLFEAADLPETTIQILAHLYERYDGSGFPDGLEADAIPLGARVLAVVETYLDVTQTDKNPYRRKLAPQEAHEACAELARSVFDPSVVDVLKRVVLGDEAKKRLAGRRDVLLVDPTPEDATLLELRLVEHGFDVVVVADLEAAVRKLGERTFHLVVTEIELSRGDGFQLLDSIREMGVAAPSVIVHTRRGDRETIGRAFERGAVDLIVKPASPDVVAVKIEQLVLKQTQGSSQIKRGVHGSLREMSLPEVIQIFSNGRKSGRLRVTSGPRIGEVHFAEGLVFDATYGGARGADAVYAMLALVDGEFELDPSFTPTENKIGMSAEGLLLEGMRRLDEAGRG